MKGLNTAEEETNDCSDCYEDSCAGAVAGHGVEGDGDTEHTSSSDEDPDCVMIRIKQPDENKRERTQDEDHVEELSACLAEELEANIVDTIHRRVVLLEGANNIVGPGCDDTNDNDDNETRAHAEGVEHGGNGKNTKTDLRLDHQHGSS